MPSIADILFSAAARLDTGVGEGHASAYTCDAVMYTCNGLIDNRGEAYEKERVVMNFLHELGLPRDASSRFDLFNDFACGVDRQGARYGWLILAATIAEGEGL
jgi:hypothetical protein